MKTLYSIPLDTRLLSIIPDVDTTASLKELFKKHGCMIAGFISSLKSSTIQYTTHDDAPLTEASRDALRDNANAILRYVEELGNIAK